MTQHKYTIGQTVTFSAPSIKLVRTKKDVEGGRQFYEVVRLLPPVGDELQYRIKGKGDDRERMVTESELDPLPQS
tara:strand:+ start:622 stop:846 length:225 start_codon:yes stop_codon:yes gene_type:complete